MSSLPVVSMEDQVAPLREPMAEVIGFVQNAVRHGEAAHDVEQGLWTRLLTMGHQLLGAYFALSGPGDVGERLSLDDGRALKRLAPRARAYRSVFGEFHIERFVYARREGQKIEAIPLDARLQLPGECTSSLLQDWTEQFMLGIPYGAALQLIERVLGVRQSMHTVERHQAAMSAGAEAFWEQLPPPPPAPPATVIADTVDGKGVFMRAGETAGEPGKKKMALLGSVYAIERQVHTPEEILTALFDQAPEAPRGVSAKPLHKHVRACLKRDAHDTTAPQVREIFDWIAQENAQRKPDQSRPIVVLIDGQESFWSAAQSAIPGEDVTEILDLIHVCGYVWEAARLCHPTDAESARATAKADLGRLLHGQVGTVIVNLRVNARTLKSKPRDTLEGIANYFANHQHRMAYDVYLAEGFPIATGVIEGACRCLVKDRMERSGMRWVMAGAQAMLALRSISLSGLWDDFWSFRIQQEIQQLYGSQAANDDQPLPLAA
jgi:hypothetical protein